MIMENQEKIKNQANFTFFQYSKVVWKTKNGENSDFQYQ